MARKWTQKETDTLRKLYPNTPTKDICKQLNRTIGSVYTQVNKLKLKKSQEYLDKYVYTIKPNVRTQFVKGQSAWNKGMKGLQIGGKETQFKKGQKAHNWKPEGSIRITVDGYTEIKIGKKFVLWHRHLYATHIGEVKPNDVIRFKDGNKQNFDLSNLEKITRGEHAVRNSVHNLPEEIKEIINLKKTITKLITEHGKRQNSRP